MMSKEREQEGYVAWFSDVSKNDGERVGESGAFLADLYNTSFPVKPGFVITSLAYKAFIEHAHLTPLLSQALRALDTRDIHAITIASEKIQNAFEHASFPKAVSDAIFEAYDILDVGKQDIDARQYAGGGALDILRLSHEPPFVAVIASTVGYDAHNEPLLNVKGREKVLASVKRAFASLFTPHALYYRAQKKISLDSISSAVVIQQMIDADKAGVMFSRNPLESNAHIVIEAGWGLLESVTFGTIIPDHYIVSHEQNIIARTIGTKRTALTRNSQGTIERVTLTPERSKQEVLTGHELKMLAHLAQRLEEQYRAPQEIAFAIAQGSMFITAIRPITGEVVMPEGEIRGEVLASGRSASLGVGRGTVRIVRDAQSLSRVQAGDVIVSTIPTSEVVVALDRASALISDEGGMSARTAHVLREFTIPAVMGTGNATKTLAEGSVVTVDGFTGRIIAGTGEKKEDQIASIVPTKTAITMRIDIPAYAARAAKTGSREAGMVRLESIGAVNGKHPAWFVRTNSLPEYIAMLVSGMREIAQSFERVWFVSSDLHREEHARLEGAPKSNEVNPLLGNHGIRFSLKNIDVFEAEIAAVKEVGDEFAQKEFGIMLPRVISVDEVRETKELLRKIGVPHNIRLGILVETPAAAHIIGELCKEGISLVSISLAALTQYILAVDKTNEQVAHLYDETHPAVLGMLRGIISECRKHHVATSICAFKSPPELVAMLVKEGATQVCVDPDEARRVSEVVAKVEERFPVAVRDSPVVTPSVALSQNTVRVSPQDETEILLAGWDGDDEPEEGVPPEPLPEEPEPSPIGYSDEYNPGVAEETGDVPTLNDAISVDSTDFSAPAPREEHRFELEEPRRPRETAIEQEEALVLAALVEEEVAASEAREAAKKQILGKTGEQEKKQSEDQTLDIF